MAQDLLVVVLIIVSAGMAAQWCAWRFHIPAIVILTATGLIVGPVTGLVDPEAAFGDLLTPMIQLAVAIILFEGGLNLRIHELQQAGSGVRRLVSLGLVFSLILGSASAYWIGGLSLPVALVFGAIIVVTGPTVIMPLLRQARLKQTSASLLKWEGIVNDPIGALLAVVTFEFFLISEPGITGLDLIGHLILSVIAASLLGLGAGLAIAFLFKRGLFPEFLKGPGVFTAVIVVYVLADLIQHDSGLLAATILGVVIGNARLPSIDEIRRFKENVTILFVSALFIVLTANIDPNILATLDWRAAALIFVIVFVVRPVAVLLATVKTSVAMPDRLLAAWIAPRGIVAAAVAAAFGPGLVEAGIDDGSKLVPLIFGLILVTVVLHGFSIRFVGRKLGVAYLRRNGLVIVGASPWACDLAATLKGMDIPVLIADMSWHRLRPARLAGLPIYFGHVVSEAAESTLDIGEMGYLLAASDNDAYNAFVCSRFANELSRNSVFQLPMPEDDQSEKRRYTAAIRGRVAFSSNAVYEELLRRYFEGWRFKKTRLTEQYTLADYQRDLGEHTLARLLVRKGGNLGLAGDSAPEAAAGDTIITFAPPEKSGEKLR